MKASFAFRSPNPSAAGTDVGGDRGDDLDVQILELDLPGEVVGGPVVADQHTALGLGELVDQPAAGRPAEDQEGRQREPGGEDVDPGERFVGDQVLGQDRDQGDDRRELKEAGDVVERRPVKRVFITVVEVEELGEQQRHRDPGEDPRRERHAADDRGRQPHRGEIGNGVGERERAPVKGVATLAGVEPTAPGDLAEHELAAHAVADLRLGRPRWVPEAHGRRLANKIQGARPSGCPLPLQLRVHASELQLPSPTGQVHPRRYCRRKQPPVREST